MKNIKHTVFAAVLALAISSTALAGDITGGKSKAGDITGGKSVAGDITGGKSFAGDITGGKSLVGDITGGLLNIVLSIITAR
jgi:hypothetical protein